MKCQQCDRTYKKGFRIIITRRGKFCIEHLTEAELRQLRYPVLRRALRNAELQRHGSS